MPLSMGTRSLVVCLGFVLLVSIAWAASGGSWNGALTDGAGKPVDSAVVTLHSTSARRDYTSTTAADGKFAFAGVAAGSYEVSVKLADHEWKAAPPIVFGEASVLTVTLALPSS